MARPDRPEFRAVPQILFIDPDYECLSSQARLVFLTLKVNLGAAGIRHLPGLIAALGEWTGMVVEDIELALTGLADAGWLERDRNTIALLRYGLEYEPFLDAANEKHRTHIQREIGALPQLALVSRFRERHAAWFPAPSDEPSETPPKGSRRPLESPSTGSRNTATTTSTSTSTSTSSPSSSALACADAGEHDQSGSRRVLVSHDCDPQRAPPSPSPNPVDVEGQRDLAVYEAQLRLAVDVARQARWGESRRIFPVPPAPNVAQRLLAAGVSLDSARRTIDEVVAKYSGDDPIASVAYFEKAIVERWERAAGLSGVVGESLAVRQELAARVAWWTQFLLEHGWHRVYPRQRGEVLLRHLATGVVDDEDRFRREWKLLKVHGPEDCFAAAAATSEYALRAAISQALAKAEALGAAPDAVPGATTDEVDTAAAVA